MRRAATLAVGVAATLAAGPALATPEAVVRALQQTPATLFDLSLARLDALLAAEGAANGYQASATYQDGRILIIGGAPEEAPSEAACRGVIDAIKRSGAVEPATGQPDQPASDFAALFAYPRLDQAAIDESYMETVDAMIAVQVTLGVSGDGHAVTCTSGLLSPDVAFRWE